MNYAPNGPQNPALLPYLPGGSSSSGSAGGGVNADIAAMNQQTIAQVGNILGGLPTVSTMAHGAYGFAGGVISGAEAAQTANTTAENNFVTTNVSTLAPIMASMARLVGNNQAASIAAASNSGGK